MVTIFETGNYIFNVVTIFETGNYIFNVVTETGNYISYVVTIFETFNGVTIFETSNLLKNCQASGFVFTFHCLPNFKMDLIS